MMNTWRPLNRVVLAVVLFATARTSGGHAAAGTVVAYSLRQAELNLQQEKSHAAEIGNLGGMTFPWGLVYDATRQDIIIVGEIVAGRQPARLDDFVVAMRAHLVHGAAPLVSIDRTLETDTTHMQKVRFEGGIEDTRMGSVLLDSDIALKQMGLGKRKTDIWGIESYFDMRNREWQKTGQADPVCSRFWFKPNANVSIVGVRENVAVVSKLVMNVETETFSPSREKDAASNPPTPIDKVGNQFATAITVTFEDISLDPRYLVLGELDTQFRLSGLAEGLVRWRSRYGWDAAAAKGL